MYVELRKMLQMNRFAGQKLRHRCREKNVWTPRGESGRGWGWWCDEFGGWDWNVYTDVYKMDD